MRERERGGGRKKRGGGRGKREREGGRVTLILYCT